MWTVGRYVEILKAAPSTNKKLKSMYKVEALDLFTNHISKEYFTYGQIEKFDSMFIYLLFHHFLLQKLSIQTLTWSFNTTTRRGTSWYSRMSVTTSMRFLVTCSEDTLNPSNRVPGSVSFSTVNVTSRLYNWSSHLDSDSSIHLVHSFQ